jgi:tetratricopeptide (TPR) repeat protein
VVFTAFYLPVKISPVTFFDWLPGHKKRKDLARIMFLIQSGFAALQGGQYQSARAAFSEALQFRDSLKGTHVLDWLLTALSSAYLMDEKFEEAVIFFSDYLRRYPGDLGAYSARATALWYAENWIPAVSDYSSMLEVNPENIAAIANRGQVLAEVGNFQAALDDLNKALQLIQSLANPAGRDIQALNQEAFIRRGRADAMAGLGDTASAMAELEKSLQSCPENAWAWYSRAGVYEKMGDRERATTDYQTSLLKIGPKLTPARRERARAWLQNP